MSNILIVPTRRLSRIEIKIPGSKSYTNRALFLAALTKGEVKIINPLISDDTITMINCLKTLGIKIEQKENLIIIKNSIFDIKKNNFKINAQISGLTIRLLIALCAVIKGTKIITGAPELNKRPIKDLVDSLIQLGANVEYLGKNGFPPIKITSFKLNSGTIKTKGSISSQYVSALLMIAPLLGEVTLEVLGKQVSKPYIDMTIDIMKKFEVIVENQNYKLYKIKNQQYKISEYKVEGDYSSAAYFLAIAALNKFALTIKNLNPNSAQADKEFLTILEKMGNKVQLGEDRVKITGKGIKALKVDMENCPDQIQTLAVLLSFAKGVSIISGISTLRIKETDRVFALRQELKKMGVKTTASKNVLRIYGGNPKPAAIETYGDHRMAMAFSVAGTKISGIEIVNPEVVNKTFPIFFKILSSIGIKTETSKNIALIGMRGSGKTTVGKLLAENLGKQYLDSDELLVKKLGIPISKIIKDKGWEFFRDKEAEMVREISTINNAVISTGGGVVVKKENIKNLKKNGKLIFLKTSVENLLKRTEKNKRPALTNKASLKEEIIEILKQREKIYESVADKIIETDLLTPKEIVNQIIGGNI